MPEKTLSKSVQEMATDKGKKVLDLLVAESVDFLKQTIGMGIEAVNNHELAKISGTQIKTISEQEMAEVLEQVREVRVELEQAQEASKLYEEALNCAVVLVRGLRKGKGSKENLASLVVALKAIDPKCLDVEPD